MLYVTRLEIIINTVRHQVEWQAGILDIMQPHANRILIVDLTKVLVDVLLASGRWRKIALKKQALVLAIDVIAVIER